MKYFTTFFLTIAFLTTPFSIASVRAEENAPKAVPVSPDGVQRLDIIVDSYSYSPAHIEVTAGKPVELNLRSVTSIVPHNFVIEDPASGIEIEQEVSSGKDVVVTFTPGNPGTYKFYCSKSGIFGSHFKKGMEGTITVVE